MEIDVSPSGRKSSFRLGGVKSKIGREHGDMEFKPYKFGPE